MIRGWRKEDRNQIGDQSKEPLTIQVPQFGNQGKWNKVPELCCNSTAYEQMVIPIELRGQLHSKVGSVLECLKDRNEHVGQEVFLLSKVQKHQRNCANKRMVEASGDANGSTSGVGPRDQSWSKRQSTSRRKYDPLDRV